MKVPFLDLKRQFDRLQPEILPAVEEVLRSGHYILGPKVAAFEKEIAEYLGVREAIGVANGTDALWLALKAAGVRPGDQVLTAPFTFFATASAIVNAGAQPVFADIRPDSFTIDPARAEKALAAAKGRIKAVIPVHLYGQAADVAELGELARRFGAALIEDAAQSIGAEYRGKKTGGFGFAGCFSFFPTKNLGGCGDAGLVTTNDAATAQTIRMLRAHGAQKKYFHDILGTNSRMDPVQAAILSVKLRHLDQEQQARTALASRYTELLAGLPTIATPGVSPERNHVFHLYTLRMREGRDSLKDHLTANGIETGVYYPLPLHLQPALRHLEYRDGDFPEAERACREALSLPLFPGMTAAEQDAVVHAVREWALSAACRAGR